MSASQMSLKSVIVLLLCVSSAFADSNSINIALRRVDLVERLGLANDSSAAFDGRFDTFLALGPSLYTARLDVGMPPQPIDFMLNWVGDLISPRVGDLSYVLTPNALGPKNGTNSRALALHDDAEYFSANGTTTFDSANSTTFKSRPDVTFRTQIEQNPLNFTVRGYFGEDVITFKDGQDKNSRFVRNITVRERQLGQVEQIEVANLFDQLNIGGMLSISKSSSLVQKMKADYTTQRILLAIGGQKDGQLTIDSGSGTTQSKLCQSQVSATYDLQKEFGNETGPGLDTYRFMIQGVNMKGPNMEYDDKIEKTVLINPNSFFIQGPRRTVAKLALMANAAKQRIGGHKLYTIDCNEQFGPLSFKLYSLLSVEKELLKIKLPSNLLPAGQCLWAIQELQEEFNATNEANAPWIFGRPIFQKYCMAIYPQQNNIAFSTYLGAKN